ncbi:benzoate/H(+) symporter BenE family transporter [Salinimonas iocasae]|uniref:Benzoate/H(+) symporter BenE family transporter n=1 Tax=Salinimonas iocasae TaxID=2572577 RepID=A0A5B7YFK2_9ALTE|nr:benzoate/H(+) symporter BenE family transporter [Salinimonas iocasae]QCZ94552.1 benzoate/H(+) symporter BenE family transporter [Salinimonas iocasae]
MFKSLSVSHIAAGLTAVVVGYSSAVVLVIEAARTAGASPDMVVSWLFALGIGMGLSCIVFSLRYKIPVVTAWSTPGAAFLLSAAAVFPLSEVIGAFVIAGICTLACAQSRALTRLITAIPTNIASALLAGIVLPICLNIFADVTQAPLITAVFIATYVIAGHLIPRYLMLLLLVLGVGCSVWLGDLSALNWQVSVAAPVWVSPDFSVASAISLGFPLFIITMLSQNVPGMAILKSYDFKPDHKTVLSGLGGLQIALGPFGGFAFNYAAITAAICMGEDAGDKREHRYLAAVVAGCAYIGLGLAAGLVVMLFTSMPEVVIHLLAGLALLGTLQSALLNSMVQERYRKAALMTLVCTASGMSLFKLGAPVWGLGLGLLMLMLERTRYKKTPSVANTQSNDT